MPGMNPRTPTSRNTTETTTAASWTGVRRVERAGAVMVGLLRAREHCSPPGLHGASRVFPIARPHEPAPHDRRGDGDDRSGEPSSAQGGDAGVTAGGSFARGRGPVDDVDHPGGDQLAAP